MSQEAVVIVPMQPFATISAMADRLWSSYVMSGFIWPVYTHTHIYIYIHLVRNGGPHSPSRCFSVQRLGLKSILRVT